MFTTTMRCPIENCDQYVEMDMVTAGMRRRPGYQGGQYVESILMPTPESKRRFERHLAMHLNGDIEETTC